MSGVRGCLQYLCPSTPFVDSPAGNLKSLNELAKQARADYIIHTGDFGFYDDSSLDRIADKYVFCFEMAISAIEGLTIHTEL